MPEDREMDYGEVIGSLSCVIKTEALNNTKYKIIKLMKPDGRYTGGYSVVEDRVGVGTGEKVLIAEDEISVAQMVGGRTDVPVRYCVVAKVENMNLEDRS